MNVNALIDKVTKEICEGIVSKENDDLQKWYEKYLPYTLGKYVDHTVLKTDTVTSTVKRFCDEAKQYHFASVCVNSSFIEFVSEQLAGSDVLPCCVIGFPFGATEIDSKVYEGIRAAELGAKEVDMVMNVGAAKEGNWTLLFKEIEAVVSAVKGKAEVKVILETCLLSDEEKVKACTVAKLAGAHFVKTSSGFSTGGATVEDVRLMRKVVGSDMGVKASTGINNYLDAVKMIDAGATRLGTSKGILIVNGDDGSGNKAGGGINYGARAKVCPTGNVQLVKGY